MNIGTNGEKKPPDEDKDAGNGVFGERRRLTQVTDLKIDASCQVEIHGATASRSQGSGIMQLQQQVAGSQGSAVCWERFLHVRTIRVLLVENDDSTRHVVTALLRNCNYEVVDAANGLQAWKILEDLNNHIDIVLTEVVMPCLSGIGLLCKILTHKTRMNVPVIMMSSHDSMGLVFKCLSRGAVDFLVKPIRKNELKNLWQHVWRRCHSSSGSGSESGTQSQTQKYVKSKASEKSGSSDEEENNGLNARDTSDDGSGAQSSWTKQAVEVDSSQALSPIDQVSECPDSTCAQVIRSNAEYSDYNKVQLIVAGEGHGQNLPDAVENKNGVEKIMHRNVVHKSENHVEGQQSNPTGRDLESTGDVANTLDLNNNATDDSKESNLELSLKRLRGEQDTKRSVQDGRYVLRRSEQSAFSRYNTSTNVFKPPNAITCSSYLLDNSMEAAKRELVGDIQVFSTDHIIYQSSNGVSNNVDKGSTTNKLPGDKSEANSAVNGLHISAIRPVKNDTRYNSPQQVSLLSNGMNSTDREPQIEHTQYHHQKPSSNHDVQSIKQFVADASHCGSTNVLGGPTLDGNDTRNCSLNRSASGSNHGSNGQNESSNAVNAVGNNNNAESDLGRAEKSRSGDPSGSGSGNKIDEIRFAQREAALIKFRLKRKERCFKKKVRYQNRKKLAEQRPRVRGQFVKQAGTEGSNSSGGE